VELCSKNVLKNMFLAVIILAWAATN
jgi:hypothetical protein